MRLGLSGWQLELLRQGPSRLFLRLCGPLPLASGLVDGPGPSAQGFGGPCAARAAMRELGPWPGGLATVAGSRRWW